MPHFQNLNTCWLNNGNVFHERWGTTKASFKHRKKAKASLNALKVAVIQNMTYNIQNNHNKFMSVFNFQQTGELEWPLLA